MISQAQKVWDKINVWIQDNPKAILGLFIITQAVTLFYFFFTLLPAYPIGWDVPYYIKQILLLERGIPPGPRVGFIIIGSMIHSITRIDIYVLMRMATPAIVLLIAIAAGMFVYYIVGRKVLGFVWTFLLTIWSSTYFLLSISTLDNAFSFGLGLTALAVLASNITVHKKSILTTVLLLFVGFTHLESFAWLVSVFILYFIIRLSILRSIKHSIGENGSVIIGTIVSVGLVVFHWRSLFQNLVGYYSTAADPTVNASIPYVQNTSVQEILQYFLTGAPQKLGIALLICAGIFVLSDVIKKKTIGLSVFFSYILCSYTVIVYSALRGSIPINRATLFVPTSILLGYALCRLFSYFPRTSPRIAIIAVMLAGVTFLNLPISYAKMLQRFPRSISPDMYHAARDFNAYIQGQDSRNYVIIVNLPKNERASSAYYQLWTNWIDATDPEVGYKTPHCVYLGNLENVLQKKITARDNDSEYLSTSEVGAECSKNLIGPIRYFVLNPYNPAAKNDVPKDFTIRNLGQNFFEFVAKN
jgi:hypothetical protein